ncbi:MAG: phosphatidate cytidylyltransferase [Pseudomonadota bacterium]
MTTGAEVPDDQIAKPEQLASPEPSPTGMVATKDSLVLRCMSGAVLGGVTLAGVYFGGPIFAAVVAFMLVFMCFEWARMIEKRDVSALFYVLALGAAGAMVTAALRAYPLAYAICFLTSLAAIWASHFGARKYSWAAFGPAYILAPCVALLWLRLDVENGRALTFLLFAIVWSADSGAYFAGRFIGGPRLSPALSPAKTWAGAAAGILFGTIAGLVGARWAFGTGADYVFALIGGSLGLVSILGDMTESAFKRVFGIKDMSGVIPGHGGALDRLDGMIFATTAMTLVLYGLIAASKL